MKNEEGTEASRGVGMLICVLLILTITLLAAINDHSSTGELTLGVFMVSLVVFCPLTVWLFFVRSFGRHRRGTSYRSDKCGCTAQILDKEVKDED